MSIADLRRLPSVERLVSQLEETDSARYPRRLVVECAREVISSARDRLLHSELVDISPDALLSEVRACLKQRAGPTLIRAVNATGVILHTNLGRAPLGARAQQAVADAMTGYSTLEIELGTGRRGSRHQHVEPVLVRITGAEAGLAVNNNAAAVLLALTALARGKQVIVSRGELVEIGGSFRLPEVMAQSGAVLVEVGTTNRTYSHDYELAITAETALLLKVHRSNFVMDGFVHDTTAAELVDIGRRRNIPVLYDLGSGCLVDMRERGLPYEPTVQDAVRAGCDVVTFSGDKLLGGPQAGIVVGRSQYIEKVRAHPLARAVRMDKLDYAALAATLQEYLEPEQVWHTLPVLKMLAAGDEELRATADRLREAVAAVIPPSWRVDVRPTIAEVGGGSLPGARLASSAVAIRSPLPPKQIEDALRTHHPPVFGRISEDAVLLDVRTLLPEDEEIIVDALKHVIRDS